MSGWLKEKTLTWGNIYFSYWFGLALMVLGISEIVHQIFHKGEAYLGDWAFTVGTWGIIFMSVAQILAAIKTKMEPPGK